MLVVLFVILFFNCILGTSIIESPCPDVLKYERRDPFEYDRWYAGLTVGTDEDLEGVWIKIFLNRRAEALGNWFAEARPIHSNGFQLRKTNYTLVAGPPLLVRFFVKYDASEDTPEVTKITLNGKVICPSNKSPPTEPTLYLGVVKTDDYETTTKKSHHDEEEANRLSIIQSSKNRLTTQQPSKRPLDDDLYLGDFYSHSRSTTTTTSRSTQHQQVQCGVAAQRASPLIASAQQVAPGQYPWHVALYVFRGAELIYSCGGTLVSASHVITAAHCVTKQRSNTLVAKDQLIVYLGKYHLLSFQGDVQDRQLAWIKVHPDYNASLLFNDIAVIKLDSPVDISNSVRPCCLWDDDDEVDLADIVGEKGTVVGWGYDETGQLSKSLMRAELPVISTKKCLISNRSFFSQFLYDKNFCIGFQNGTAVCNGDSGGGFVLPKKSSSQTTVWHLRGVICVGVAKQSENVCNPEQYSLVTDAAKFTKWIKTVIN